MDVEGAILKSLSLMREAGLDGDAALIDLGDSHSQKHGTFRLRSDGARD